MISISATRSWRRSKIAATRCRSARSPSVSRPPIAAPRTATPRSRSGANSRIGEPSDGWRSMRRARPSTAIASCISSIPAGVATATILVASLGSPACSVLDIRRALFCTAVFPPPVSMRKEDRVKMEYPKSERSIAIVQALSWNDADARTKSRNGLFNAFFLLVKRYARYAFTCSCEYSSGPGF